MSVKPLPGMLCLLLFLALTFEAGDFAEGKFSTFMALAAPLFAGNPVSPWDVAIALVGLLALLRRGSLRHQVGPLNLAVATSAVAVAALVAWGLARGGDLRMAYFQLSAFLRLLLLFPVCRAVFRTRRELGLLAFTLAAAAVLRAVACVRAHRFFLAELSRVEWPQSMTDHHDSALWTIVLVGLAFGLASGVRAGQLVTMAAAIPLLLLAVHYNDRRLAWLELVGGLVMGYLVVPSGRFSRRLNRVMLVAAPLLALYVAVGWGRSSAVFAPVRQIRSMLASEGDGSNTYRDLENIGLVITLQSSRLLGTGFGHQFHEVTDMYRNIADGFADYRYIPHNSVLWLASVGGVLGFPLLWTFLPVGAYFAARARAYARRPLDRVLATAAFAYMFVYGVQAYGDMGFQSFKASVLLACALAAASRLAIITEAWPVRRVRRRAALTQDEPRGRIVHA